MDQLKIGKFIAEQRKKNNLTQMQLAEKLNITDRAVSKWENGKAMPDVATIPALCDILGVTINDLFTGEVVSVENYNKKMENNLMEMAQELERKNKTVWRSMWIIMWLSMAALLAGCLAVWYFVPEEIWQVVAVLGLCVVFLNPCFYALKLEISVGAYKCKKCGHEIVPTYSQALNAMHMGTTRYLKCPTCGKRRWCKKVLKKS